jgi:hypothetical protein
MIVRLILITSIFFFSSNLSSQEIVVQGDTIGRYLSREEFRNMKKGMFTLENGNHWRLHKFGFGRRNKKVIELYPNAHIDKISKFNKSSKIAVCGIGLAAIAPQAIEMPTLINQLNQIQISSSSELTLGDDLEHIEVGEIIGLSFYAYHVCDLVDRILINRYLNGRSKYYSRTAP